MDKRWSSMIFQHFATDPCANPVDVGQFQQFHFKMQQSLHCFSCLYCVYSDGWCLCDFVWSILALHILCRTEVTDSHQLYSITVFSPAYCLSESRNCAGRHDTICKHSIGIYWLYIEASQNDVLPSTLEIWIGCAEKPKSCRTYVVWFHMTWSQLSYLYFILIHIELAFFGVGILWRSHHDHSWPFAQSQHVTAKIQTMYTCV